MKSDKRSDSGSEESPSKKQKSESGSTSAQDLDVSHMDTQHSAESDPIHPDTEMLDVIISSARFSHKGVKFDLGKNRVDVEVVGASGKKSQGDHVTSYTSFLEFLFGVTLDKSLVEIPGHLLKSIKAILPDIKGDKLEEIRKKYEEKLKDYLTKDERKDLTSKSRIALLNKCGFNSNEIQKTADPTSDVIKITDLFDDKGELKDQLQIKSGDYISFNLGGADRYYKINDVAKDLTSIFKKINLINNDTSVQKLRNSLKLAENTLVGQLILDLNEVFIKEINLAEDIAFAKKKGETDTAEGNRVKQSRYTLRLINELKRIDEIDPKEQDKLKYSRIKILERITEERSELKQGLKNIVVKDPQIISNFDAVKAEKDTNQTRRDMKAKIEKEIKDKKKGSEKIDDVDEETAKRINDAIKRGYDKVINQEIDNILKDNGKNLFTLLKTKEKEMPQIIGEKFGDMFDFKQKIDRDLATLAKVSSRHLVIMFHAFDKLQNFSKQNQKEMIDTFIVKEILENQEWKNHKMSQTNNLTKSDIENKMNNYSKLENNNYKMLSLLEIKKLKDQQQSQGRT